MNEFEKNYTYYTNKRNIQQYAQMNYYKAEYENFKAKLEIQNNNQRNISSKSSAELSDEPKQK